MKRSPLISWAVVCAMAKRASVPANVTAAMSTPSLRDRIALVRAERMGSAFEWRPGFLATATHVVGPEKFMGLPTWEQAFPAPCAWESRRIGGHEDDLDAVPRFGSFDFAEMSVRQATDFAAFDVGRFDPNNVLTPGGDGIPVRFYGLRRGRDRAGRSTSHALRLMGTLEAIDGAEVCDEAYGDELVLRPALESMSRLRKVVRDEDGEAIRFVAGVSGGPVFAVGGEGRSDPWCFLGVVSRLVGMDDEIHVLVSPAARAIDEASGWPSGPAPYDPVVRDLGSAGEDGVHWADLIEP